jgi:Major Facilitator Superfamily
MNGLPSRMAIRAWDSLASACVAWGVPLLVLRETGSVSSTGMSFALEWTPRLLSLGFIAPWVDRFGARVALRTGSWARTAAIVTTMAAVSAGADWLVLTAMAAVGGVLAQVTQVATTSLGADQARGTCQDVARRVQLWQAAVDQGVLLLGPLLAGLLALSGAPGVLFGAAALSATTTVVVGRLPKLPSPVAAGKPSRSGLRVGAAVMRRYPALMWATLAGLGVNALASVVESGTPILVTQVYHHTAAASGAVWCVAAAVSATSLVVFRKAVTRWGTWTTAAISAVVTSAAAVAAGLASGFELYVVAVAAMSAAEQGVVVLIGTARNRLIPAESYASTLSLGSLMMLVPFPVTGLLIAAGGGTHLPDLLLGCGALTVLTAAVSLGGLRHYRAQLDTPPKAVSCDLPDVVPPSATTPVPALT